jgi:bile acid-coenzyme A ligase
MLLKDGESAAELPPSVRNTAPRYKLPRGYEFVDEPLRDEAGKERRAAPRKARLARTSSGQS